MKAALPPDEVGGLKAMPEANAADVAAELDEETQRYRFLADTVPLLIWTTRPDGCVVYYNKACLDYTGLTLEQTEDWGWGAVIHPDDLQQCIQCWTHSLTTGENYEVEYRLKCATDETYRWFLGRAKAQRNDKGEIVQWVGTCTDIDEQKRVRSDLEIRVAERTTELAKSNENLQVENVKREQIATALMEATRFLRSTLDALSAHIAILDEHGTIIEINRAWNRFARDNDYMGKPCGVGDNYLEVCDLASGEYSKEAPMAASGIRAVMAGKREEFYLEYPCHGPQEQRWFILRVTRFGGDGPARVVVAHENISERKRMEVARDRLAVILEASTDLIGFSDPAGRILFLNRAARNALGVDSDEDISKAFAADFIPNPASHLTVTEGIPTAIRQGTWSGDVALLSRRGKEILVSQVVLAHKTAAGELEYISTIMRDITKQRRLEAQVFQSQKMETVGKLAGGIAHEFNSILTAIIGHSEILLSDLPPGNPLCKNAAGIRISADRAATLTRQLLAYGRKQNLQLQNLELNSILATIETPMRGLLSRHTDLRIAPAAELKPAKADPQQIEEVIVNLVMNAADAMPDGGKLTLETANVTLDQEYVSHIPELKTGEYVMLAITDTGTGMSEDVKAHVFEPFFTTKGVGQGTGLGLSTCYGIIKQSGGHISVYSELGRGTTFKIYLPKVESQTTIAIKQPDPSALPHGAETILLVEDDPSLREAASTLLTRLGYTIVAAANGIEALNMQRQSDIGRFDLLFTDVAMPQMSGRELAEKMQTIHPRIRILYTSGYTENAIVHQGALDKGVALLQKPFTPSALANKLREVLDQREENAA